MGLQLKVGGKFHLKLNMGGRPIANKYREGKMKRTLKRESKVLEIAEREPKETSVGSAGASLQICLVRVSSVTAGDAGPGGRVLASETGPELLQSGLRNQLSDPDEMVFFTPS